MLIGRYQLSTFIFLFSFVNFKLYYNLFIFCIFPKDFVPSPKYHLRYSLLSVIDHVANLLSTAVISPLR